MVTMDKRIKFDERYDSTTYNTTTLYFTAPKEMLKEMGYDYPKAESMEISIEFPINEPDANKASVEISPTEYGSDYDWNDIDLPNEEIESLIDIGMRESVGKVVTNG